MGGMLIVCHSPRALLELLHRFFPPPLPAGSDPKRHRPRDFTELVVAFVDESSVVSGVSLSVDEMTCRVADE